MGLRWEVEPRHVRAKGLKVNRGQSATVDKHWGRLKIGH